MRPGGLPFVGLDGACGDVIGVTLAVLAGVLL